MGSTTFQIGAALQALFPACAVKHLRNFEVQAGATATDMQIAGVMVRYEVVSDDVRWCYV